VALSGVTLPVMTNDPGHSAPPRVDARAFMPEPLRADVRMLTSLLGEVITEDGGPELLEDVERLRELSISAVTENNGGQKLAAAETLVDSFTPERAEAVARAFTCYFHLVNLAEEYHRVRTL